MSCSTCAPKTSAARALIRKQDNMDLEIFKSYLVQLGFAVDQPQLKKFELGLKDAATAVEVRTGGIVRDLIKWQTGATAAFVGVSTAVVGLAEHVAGMDNKYRLMGLRMFMTTEQTRKMQMSLESLGVTLEDAIWDPETRARFIDMEMLQNRLSLRLGVNFSANMVKIRDLKENFQELRVEVEYLGMAFVSKLIDKAGPGLDNLEKQVSGFLDYVIDKMPEWTDEFSSSVLPVLQETWGILKEIGTATGEFATLFTNLVGLLAGDDSIEGSEFSFEKLGGAIKHVIGFLDAFIHAMLHAERMLIHFADAAVLALSGKFADAKTELLKGLNEFTVGSGAILGTVAGAPIGGTVGTLAGGALGGAIGSLVGPAGTVIGAGIGGAFGGALGTGVGGLLGAGIGGEAGALKQSIAPSEAGEGMSFSLPRGNAAVPEETQADQNMHVIGPNAIRGIIDATAKLRGLDPRLAEAVARQESGGRQVDSHGRTIQSSVGATGVMQLMPSTAKGLGVDAHDAAQNIDGGERMLKRLIDKYQSVPKALAAYNWGEGHLDNAIRRHQTSLPPETLNYVRSIMAQTQGHSMTTGDIIVNVLQPNATPDQMAAAVKKGVSAHVDAQTKETQRTVAQLAYVG
jgi:hypothetical protein